MKLTPTSPPGRSNRKARAFAVEIGRLHREGYTCQTIREALAEVGVIVSRSTVQREVARASTRPPPVDSPRTARDPSQSTSPAASLPQDASLSLRASATRSGQDVAEGFVKGRITNPLILTRNRDEDSRH